MTLHCPGHFQCVARPRRLVNRTSRRHADIEPQMCRTRRPNRNRTQRTRPVALRVRQETLLLFRSASGLSNHTALW